MEDGLRLLTVDASRNADAALALGVDRDGRIVVVCLVCGSPTERHVQEALERAGRHTAMRTGNRTRVLIVGGHLDGSVQSSGREIEFREYLDLAEEARTSSVDPLSVPPGTTLTEDEIASLLPGNP